MKRLYQKECHVSFCLVFLNKVKDFLLAWRIERYFIYVQHDRLYLNEIFKRGFERS